MWCKPGRTVGRQSHMGESDTLDDLQQHSAETPGSDRASQPGPAAEQPGGRPRWVLIAAAIAGAGMVTAGIAIAVFSPSGGPAYQSADHGTQVQQPAVPAPSGHVKTNGHTTTAGHTTTGQSAPSMPPGVASDGIAKTALRFPKHLTRQVSRWEAGPGGKALGQVTVQMGYALQAAGSRLYPTMKQACASLASEAQTAQTEPPIPDAAMQRMYGRALAMLSQAAASCLSAISVKIDDESTDIHVNRALLGQSLTGLAAGSKTLYKATAEVRIT